MVAKPAAGGGGGGSSWHMDGVLAEVGGSAGSFGWAASVMALSFPLYKDHREGTLATMAISLNPEMKVGFKASTIA